MGIRSVFRILVGLALVGASVTSAYAQSPGGAFERLSPGDQKIARSLFAAQRSDVPPRSRLSLDQIAARRNTAGWGGLFDDLKSQQLVTAKNFGQIVHRAGNTGRWR